MLLFNYIMLNAILFEDNSELYYELVSYYSARKMSDLLRANLQMITVFVMLRDKLHQQASAELKGLKKKFANLNCKRGLAIVFYFKAKVLSRMTKGSMK